MPTNGESIQPANGVTNGHEYDVQNLYHSQITKPIKAICIGSGISGMCLAFTMLKSMSSFELTIYEKNKDIGGTWFENTYPGCACDIPAHLYTFSWEPKHDWSKYYADSSEIHRYCKDFYNRNQLSRFTKLEHRVRKAVWQEDTSQWAVEVEDLSTGLVVEDQCDVLVNATGFLNKWTWPKIDGIGSFTKPKTHSAAWDHSLDYKDKTIGIIGTGSSAIQIVPQMQKVGKKCKVFMRSPTWITPAIGGETAAGEFKSNQVSKDNPGHQQFVFTEEQKRQFKEDPEHHLQFRKQIEAEVNWMADVFMVGSTMQKDTQQTMIQQMKNRIGEGHDELASKLIPQWPPGCRRLTPGDRYLESLVESNVEPIFGDIQRIDHSSIVTMDGTHHEVDILVCATGFDVSFVPSFEIVGRNGLNMASAWKDLPDAYLGLAAPNFPNYFIICGPQGPLGNGSILPAIEVICDYISKTMLKMQAERIKSVEPKRRATTQFQEHMHKFHQKSVWGQPCRSWYKNGKVDGEPQLWCGTALSYIKTIRNPRFEDYEIDYESSNQWAFLGNGKIKAHNLLPDGKPDIEGLAPYIRNSDTPWEI